MTKIRARQFLLVTPPGGKMISSNDHFVILITRKLDTYLLWVYATIEIEKYKRQSHREHKDLCGSALGLHPRAASRRNFTKKIWILQRWYKCTLSKPKPQIHRKSSLSPQLAHHKNY